MASAKKKHDLVLSELSGPVSLSYLVPTQPHLPLVLLLGDVHHADTHRCNPCSPPDCYPIESLTFLKALDELAEEYPIDFFTESDPHFQEESENEHIRTPNVLFQYLIRNTVRRCHQVPLRLTPGYDDCPTSRIRWHYADVRSFPHSVEGYMYHPIQYVLERVMMTEEIHRENAPQKKRMLVVQDNHSEPQFESFGYIIQESFPILRSQFPSMDLFEAGRRFMTERLRVLSQWKATESTSEPVASALCHIFHLFQESDEILSLTMKGAIPNHPIAQTILSHLQSHAPHLEPYQEPLYHLIWTIFPRPSPFKPKTFSGRGEIMEFVTRLADIVFRIATFIHEQFQAYITFIEREKSALWKQYRKQTLPYLRDPSQWVILLTLDILRYPTYFAPFVKLYFYQSFFPVEPLYPFLEQLLTTQSELVATPLPTVVPVRPEAPTFVPTKYGSRLLSSVASALYYMMIFMKKGVLDLYLLLRMLKAPGKGIFQEEGVAGVLSIAFLGNEHSRHLRELLLVHPFSYQERALAGIFGNYNTDDVSRCLRLSEPLSLRSELERHVSSIKEWPNLRNRYLRRIAEENRGRGRTRRNRNKSNKSNKGNKGNKGNLSRKVNRNENNNAFYGV